MLQLVFEFVISMFVVLVAKESRIDRIRNMISQSDCFFKAYAVEVQYSAVNFSFRNISKVIFSKHLLAVFVFYIIF